MHKLLQFRTLALIITTNSTRMTYELTMFDELVYGSLSPFYAEGNNREKQLHFLNEHFGNCERITIGQFKKEKSATVFQDKSVICCIHPEMKKYNSQQLELFQETNIDQIDPDIIANLELDSFPIKKALHQKQLKKMSIGIVQASNWETLSDANLKYYYYCGLLMQEKEKLIVKIKNKVHQLNSKEEIEQYIHKNQQALIALCIKVLNQSNFERKYCKCKIRDCYTDQDIMNLIYHYLEKVIRFIESNYLQYINKTVTIPYKSKLIDEYELNSKGDFVKSILLDAELNSEIRSIALTPIFRLNQFNVKDRISYQELIYYNTYISQFYTELKTNPLITEGRIIEIMFHVNYNAISFLEYLQKQIVSTLNELHEKNLQLDYLYKILKETNQKNICSHLAFAPSDLSLKVLLSAWIEEEIQYITKILNNQDSKDSLFTTNNQKEVGKIQSELTVSELALLFRILHDTDALPHDNQSELIQFIAESFYTKKAESISVASLRTKYYSPDNGTLVSLKLKIEKILLQINQY